MQGRLGHQHRRNWSVPRELQIPQEGWSILSRLEGPSLASEGVIVHHLQVWQRKDIWNRWVLQSSIYWSLILTKPSLATFVRWSNTNKHTNITLEPKTAKNLSGGHNAVLIEPKLNLNQTQSVRLKILAMQSVHNFVIFVACHDTDMWPSNHPIEVHWLQRYL